MTVALGPRAPTERTGSVDRSLHSAVLPGLGGVTHALLESLERLAVVEVGRMDGVPSAAQLLGKVDTPRREAQRVMKQDHLGHVIESVADPRDLGVEA